MLLENEKFHGIVSDRGVAAIHGLENYPAFSHIRPGHTEEAQVHIESLERKCASSLILTRGADRRFQRVPGFQVAENLRTPIE